MRESNCKRRVVAGMSNALAMALILGLGATTVQAQQTAAVQEGAVAGAANPFFDKAKFGYQQRTSYFDRDISETSRARAAGFGGWLYGQTGEIADILSFGGTYNFTLPLYSPDTLPPSTEANQYNYILRDPDQSTNSVIGEAYAKVRFGDHAGVFGRQTIRQAWYLPDVVRFYNKLDQSMIGPRDVRGMQNIHYEAATYQGRFMNDTLRGYAGYIWNARQINDNKFRNMYAAAYETQCGDLSNKTPQTACPGFDSNGAAYVGVQFKPNNNLMVEGSYYNFQNMMDNVYVDFDYVFRMADKNYFRVGTQYMYQGGSGDNVLSSGQNFSTNYVGFYGELRLTPHIVPYAMVGWTGTGQQIRSPYSIGPSYLVQRVGENSRAGEDTWIAGAIFDFGVFGAKGLSFDVSYGQRTDRRNDPQVNNGSPINDWNELATDLVYFLPDVAKYMKNFRARARWAKVEEPGALAGGGDKMTYDRRFDVHFLMPFK
jgi:hypothetical protein